MARGSIIERGNSYRVMVSYRDITGRRKQLTATAPSIRKAETLRTELMNQVNNGILGKPKGTLADFLNRWMSEYANPNLASSTLKGYEYIIRYHLIPALGHILLKNLRPEHLQHYYSDKIKAGLSTTSVKHHHALLHRAFKQAVQLGLLPRNPTDSVSAPKVRRKEMHTLNEDQIAEILSQDTPYYCLFYLALQTGLRRGELLKLRWSDINLNLAELSVSSATKTPRSRRPIALSPQTCIVLREHLDKQMEIQSRLKLPFRNDSLVFCHVDGSPWKGNTVWIAWNTMLKRLGITGIRFHDIRHTMATVMLQAGIHPKIVQERLGHTSISTTLDVYSHVAPELQKAAANKLDSIFVTSDRKSVTNPLPLA